MFSGNGERKWITKNDIATVLSIESGYNYKDVKYIIDRFLDISLDHLYKGDKVVFNGFVTFERGVNKERMGRNPKTNMVEKRGESYRVNCRVSSVVKDKINGR